MGSCELGLYEGFYVVLKHSYHEHFAVAATLAVAILSWATARVATTRFYFKNKT
jgi:hypothetical protein